MARIHESLRYICPVHLRYYKPDDFHALYAIEERCFPPRDRFSPALMRRYVTQANGATWIAEDERGMCGFAIIEWRRNPPDAYIQTIEVLEQHRGKGIGSALLRAVIDSARVAGSTRVLLHVAAANVGAIHLYEAHDFVCVGTAANYYGQRRDALVYQRLLSAE